MKFLLNSSSWLENWSKTVILITLCHSPMPSFPKILIWKHSSMVPTALTLKELVIDALKKNYTKLPRFSLLASKITLKSLLVWLDSSNSKQPSILLKKLTLLKPGKNSVWLVLKLENLDSLPSQL